MFGPALGSQRSPADSLVAPPPPGTRDATEGPTIARAPARHLRDRPPHRHEHGDRAAAYIAAQGPDLSWVYLEYTDDVAHAEGNGEAFDTAVRRADAVVGRIWAAVQRREAMGESWMVVVTTDHGRDADTGRGHGGQTERERRTWIATNQSALEPRFADGSAAIVDIAPSILQFLGIAVPAPVARQLDGSTFLRR